jgi:hypothetical protein
MNHGLSSSVPLAWERSGAPGSANRAASTTSAWSYLSLQGTRGPEATNVRVI